jgi:hypothetical protein
METKTGVRLSLCSEESKHDLVLILGEQMNHGKLFAIAFLLATFIGPADVWARECVTRQPDAETTARMFDVALSIRNALDALSPDVKVVMLARGGQDLSRFGLVYSHLAFALRDSDGQCRVVHELNVCKTDQSDLYREGLVNFVGESILRADVLVVVPQMTLQGRLQKLLASEEDTARLLHESRYSLVAYPFSTRYQNSNQWVLEMLAAAMMPAHDRPVSRNEVQIWLRKAGIRLRRCTSNCMNGLQQEFGWTMRIRSIIRPASVYLATTRW